MSTSFSVVYTSSALKDLRNLEKKTSQKIVLIIQRYTNNNPLENSKKLSGIFEDLYRYRIGDYRVIFQIDNSDKTIRITILKIKHRKDVYRKI